MISDDFNRDGIPDLATANVPFSPPGAPVRSTIGVVLGARSNTLGALTELALDGNAIDIVAADFNRDTNPDLAAMVVRQVGSPQLCSYLGNGRGGFSGPFCTDVSGPMNRLAAANLNRDGFADLAGNRALDNLVVTFLSNGNGTFRTGATLTTLAVHNFTLADFNRDGAADLAAYVSGGLLAVVTGAGDGSFFQQTSFPSPPGPAEVVAGDLNRDGRPDLVVASFAGQSVNVYLNTGASLGPPKMLATPFSPGQPYLADLNGDGAPELWTIRNDGISVFRNDGSGQLSLPTSIVALGPWSRFAVGDFNGDSLLDVAATGFGGPAGGFLAAMFGRPTGTISTLGLSQNSAAYRQPLTVTIGVIATDASTGAPSNAPVQLVANGGVVANSILGATLPGAPPNPPVGSGAAQAVFSWPAALPPGDYSLVGFFPGTLQFTGSSSTPVRLTVLPAPAFWTTPPVVTVQRDSPVLPLIPLESSNGVLISEGRARLLCDGGRNLAEAVPQNGRVEFRLPPNQPLGPLVCRAHFADANFLPAESGDIRVIVTGQPAIRSAAHAAPRIAPGGLATIGLAGLAVPAEGAVSLPWPESLSNVRVEFELGGGFGAALLSYAGPNQINLFVPAALPPGPRRYRVRLGADVIGEGMADMVPVAPGIFTANGIGTGVPAALAALYGPEGVRPVDVFRCEPTCVPAAMPLGGPDDVLAVSLYGTGLRNAGSVTVAANGRPLEVQFFGPHVTIHGLDQVNVLIRRGQAPSGEFDLVLAADGVAANTVRLHVE